MIRHSLSRLSGSSAGLTVLIVHFQARAQALAESRCAMLRVVVDVTIS